MKRGRVGEDEDRWRVWPHLLRVSGKGSDQSGCDLEYTCSYPLVHESLSRVRVLGDRISYATLQSDSPDIKLSFCTQPWVSSSAPSFPRLDTRQWGSFA